ncbi:MAG: hydantoinase/oxoprolinase family protein [Candidatus Dormibacteria bacterium]
MTWRLAVDIGGTFTDLVGWDEAADRVASAKVLTDPDDPVRGVTAAIESAGLHLSDTTAFIHGSTIAINAVLQGTGAKTALLTTRGFRDVLEMGRKSRPDMYNLFFRPRLCPVPRRLRLEVAERYDASGNELTPLDPAELTTVLEGLPEDVESLAICFLHAYANPEHERTSVARARALRPKLFVSASSDLSGEFGEYERTATAVVNAYVGPLVTGYVRRLRRHMQDEQCMAPLLIMQSNGGVMTSDVAAIQPIRTVESGPAAGVVGTAWLGRQVRQGDLIAFDMGGTSAKACSIHLGEPEASSKYYIGGRLEGLPVQVPFLNIIEVGAGGGSIAYVDAGGGLRVGPRSAGSSPGPAAYAIGGVEPTITDANVVAGRIDPAYFLGGAMRLDAGLARAAIERIATPLGLTVDACALGVIRIANAIMSAAIRSVTIEQGRDPRDYTLVAYGGAGPVHASALAAELQIPEVIVPAGAGTFAASGMLVTDLRHDVARTLVGRLDALEEEAIEAVFQTLETEAHDYVGSRLANRDQADVTYIRKLDLRYVGQFHPLTLTVPRGTRITTDIPALFHAAHAERYGHNAPSERIEVGALRVTAISEVPKPPWLQATSRSDAESPPEVRPVLLDDGTWAQCRVLRRHLLEPGIVVDGPAIIEDPATNVVVGPADSAMVLDGHHVRIRVGNAAA